MPLELLPACIFTGPALPEPFVRLELEQALTKAGLLARVSGTEGKALHESWERYERKLRELVVRGGSERVFNHVLLPLVERLGYAQVVDGGKVRTSLEDEDGGRLFVAADGSRLRVWASDLEADLDAPGRRGAAARYSPLRVAQRVLLAERERMGLLTNGVELRLVISDPARTDSQVIMPIATLWRRRRAVPDSYRLLLALAAPAGLRQLPTLIEQARQQQTRVTNDLRRQAREAIEGFIQAILDHPENRFQVSGVRFQGAATRDQVSEVRGQGTATRDQVSEVRGQGTATRDQVSEVRGQGAATRDQVSQVRDQGTATVPGESLQLDAPDLADLKPDTRHLTPESLWREGLVVVYRLLVILKLAASDDPARRFSFADSAIWRGTYAPGTALAPIVRAVLDEGAETGQLLEDGLRQLFRLFAEGVESQELTVKPLAGGLFDPAATPTLAGLRWGERAVALLLDRLLWTPRGKGSSARERVSYAALDVEDLGRVYEALLELEPGIAAEPMCRLRRQKLEVVVPIAQGIRYQVSGIRGQGSGVRGRSNERQQLSGSEGVAESDGSGSRVLQADRGVPQERDVRVEQPASEGSGLSAGEHCGGAGEGSNQGISPSPLDRKRLAHGAGDAPADRGSTALHRGSGVGSPTGANVGGGQDAEWADKESEDEDELTPGTRNLKPTNVEWIEAIPPGRFYLRVGLGRKSSGSYYTPRSFVRFLVQETVCPQCDERSPDADPQPARILALRVLDPAMGSGHFLVEACRFLGDRLYEACRRCDELASAAEAQAAKLKERDPAESARLAARAEELRQRVEALPDPDNALVAYLPSRAREGDQPGLSEQKARALCRRLAAVHCLYGVDKNPLAVALARVAIWIEAHAEGLPLTFLDHRLMLGDSLTGPFAEHLARYPGSQNPLDNIFNQGLQARLQQSLAAALSHVAALEESVGIDVADIERKRAAKTRLDAALAPFRLLAAAWAGGVMLGTGKGGGCDDDAYVALARQVSGVRFQVSGEGDAGLTPDTWNLTPTLRRMLARGLGLRELPETIKSYEDALTLILTSETWNLTPAFPYDLAFPEVFYAQVSGFRGQVSGADEPGAELTPDTRNLIPELTRHGFDVVVGNPPWDAVQPLAKEFFAVYDFDILAAPTRRERDSIEKRLLSTPGVTSAYGEYVAEIESVKGLLLSQFRWVNRKGDGQTSGAILDLWQVFAERAAELLQAAGVVGVVVPSAFHANEGATGIRRLYFEQMATRCCYSFENRQKLFEIHSSFKFAPVVASRAGPTTEFPCAFYLHDDAWLFEHNGREPLRYSLDFIRRTGGDYLSLLELRSRQDYEVAQICFTGSISFGALLERLGIRFGEELHMSKSAHLFKPTTEVYQGTADPRDPNQAHDLLEHGYFLLHEGKTFHQFTDHWDKPPRYVVHIDQFKSRTEWMKNIPHYRLAFREIASSTNERTAIFNISPPWFVYGHKAPSERVAYARPYAASLLILSLADTFVFDMLLRQRVQSSVSHFMLNPLPVPRVLLTPETRHLKPFLAHSALRLTCNHAGYAALWREQVGEAWREERAPFDWPVLAGDDARWAVRAAIDAVVAEAYGLSREQYAHVLSTFSHKSYPQAPERCLAAFDDLKALGLETFTKQHDPYWDIPLNEALPEPVIDLPIPAEAEGGRRGRRGAALSEPTPLYANPQLALDIGEEPAPAQQVIDFAAAAAARRGSARKAAEGRAGYGAGEAAGAATSTTAGALSPLDHHVIFLAYAVQKHRGTRFARTLGHVKAEKLAHLAESHLGIDLGRQAVRDAAGPVDFPHLKRVLKRGKDLGAFEDRPQKGGEGYQLVALGGLDKIAGRLNEAFGDQADAADALITSLMGLTSHEIEAIATLYAVWNDLLRDGETPDDERIFAQFWAWHPNKAGFQRGELLTWITWMRATNLVPSGAAKPTLRRSLALARTDDDEGKTTFGDNDYERVQSLLAERGQLTSDEVQFALAIDANAARALLRRLVDEGLARVEGEKRETRYVVVTP